MVECECRVSRRLPIAAILAPKLSLVLGHSVHFDVWSTPSDNCWLGNRTLWKAIALYRRKSKMEHKAASYTNKQVPDSLSRVAGRRLASKMFFRGPLFYTSGLRARKTPVALRI